MESELINPLRSDRWDSCVLMLCEIIGVMGDLSDDREVFDIATLLRELKAFNLGSGP